MDATFSPTLNISPPQEKIGFFSRFTWRDTLFFLTVGSVLVWSIVLGIIGGTELVFSPFASLWRAFIVLLALRCIFLNKYTLIFTLVVLGISLLFLGIGALLYINHTPDPYGYAPPRATPVLFNIGYFIGDIMNYITGATAYQGVYDTFIQWSLTAAFAAFVFIFGFLWFNFFALLGVSAAIFGLILNTGFFFYTMAFYLFVFCVLAYLIRYLNQRSMMNGKSSPFSLYAMPLTAVCLALALVLPSPQEGAARNLADNLITRPFNAINNLIQDFLHPRYFTLSQTGFGMAGERRLGGNVTLNNNLALRVNPSAPMDGPLYLTGNILDKYTGYSWLNSFEDDQYALDFDSMSQIAALAELNASNLTFSMAELADNLLMVHHHPQLTRIGGFPVLYYPFDHLANVPLSRSSVLIEHVNRSFTVFTTGIVTGFTPPVAGMEFSRGTNGTVLADRLMRREARYTINFTSLRTGLNPYDALELSRPGILAETYAIVRELETEGFRVYTMMLEVDGRQIHYLDLLANYLIPRANHIREVYTALPENLPTQVSELAGFVVEQAGAQTTLEMAQALDVFLRASGNFGYSLTPGPSPVDRDFVDHFLFDLQTGYCVHFASAFVVMARSLGLPARYIEGFIVTGTPDEYGYLDVINRQGHAWAEVYFEGFGWHIFDPTPPEVVFTWGYAYHTPTAPAAPTTDIMDDFWRHFGDEPAPDEYYDFIQYANGGSFTPDQVTEQNLGANIVSIIIYALLIVSGLILAFVIFRVLYIGTTDRRIAKRGTNEAIVANFQRILRYLNVLDFEKHDDETALAFARRVGNRMYFDNKEVYLFDLVDVFYRANFGSHILSAEEQELFERAVRTLDRRMWEHLGAGKYLLHKYILATV